LIRDQNPHRQGTAGEEGKPLQKDSKAYSVEEDDAKRPWNVPDDEWDWSEEEPPSAPPGAATTERRSSSLTVPSGGRTNTPNSLGLINASKSYEDTKNTTESLSSSISASSSRANDSSATSLTGFDDPNPLSVAQDLHISMCDSGRFIACASKKAFTILKRQTCTSPSRTPMLDVGQKQGSSALGHEWVLIGQGSNLDTHQ
jgi:hypothetical protein